MKSKIGILTWICIIVWKASIRYPCVAVRDALVAVREALVAVRDALVAVRDALVAVRDALVAVRDALVAVRDAGGHHDTDGLLHRHGPLEKKVRELGGVEKGT